MPSMMKAPHSKGANCAMCNGGPCKMAEGGEPAYKSGYGSRDQDFQPGVHGQSARGAAGTSVVGHAIRKGDKDLVKSIHREKLSHLKSEHGPTSGRSGFAKGGDVEGHEEPDGDDDMDTELSHGLGKELLSAFESKDHKKLMSSLEACVLHCMSKGDDDV